ncbi:small ribosomal subunit protein bS21c-like [Gastrolobium bilobum]|uniref:small ribosomal subunit protein bS21c-like n=1 Tax=Gastrolobium bilobum TaxID=150636 RepID=UPI002AB270A5|nr:small ribosomal subunit protein bS21c-like [Gastrolobium bilobum]
MAVSTTFLPSTWPCPLSSLLRLPKMSSRSRWCSVMAATASASEYLRGSGSDLSISGIAIAYPALAYSTTLYSKAAYNVQIIVGDDEPEDKLVYRFKKEVLKAGVLQECRRRRFFENKHDKIKRKAREASRRNRKRRPQSRAPAQSTHDSPKKKEDEEEYDHWELPDVDIPYC